MKKNHIIYIVLFLMIFVSTSCAKNDSLKDKKTIIIKDILGREVGVLDDINTLVALGPGALRQVIYAGGRQRLIGIEKIEKDSQIGRSYALADDSLKELEIVGLGGPNNSIDYEKLMMLKPDVIFTTYASDKKTANLIQEKTKIPVVVIGYGDTSVFDEEFNKSIKIIANILKKEQRGDEVLEYIEDIKEELDNRTKNIENKPKVYIGALSMKGSHGISSTHGNYSLFEALNANQVTRKINIKGSCMIDREKLIEWNPDIIFIDSAGYDIVVNDYMKNKAYYNSLDAFKKGDVYTIFPYNYYNTNIDMALINAYYMGKIMYPQEFADIDIEIKAKEIFDFFVGKDVLNEFEKEYNGFKRIELE